MLALYQCPQASCTDFHVALGGYSPFAQRDTY